MGVPLPRVRPWGSLRMGGDMKTHIINESGEFVRIGNPEYPNAEMRCPTCGSFGWTDTEAPNGVKPIITKGSCPGPIVNRKASRKMDYARFDNRYHEIWE